jgi:hypothetical protein
MLVNEVNRIAQPQYRKRGDYRNPHRLIHPPVGKGQALTWKKNKRKPANELVGFLLFNQHRNDPGASWGSTSIPRGNIKTLRDISQVKDAVIAPPLLLIAFQTFTIGISP